MVSFSFSFNRHVVLFKTLLQSSSSQIYNSGWWLCKCKRFSGISWNITRQAISTLIDIIWPHAVFVFSLYSARCPNTLSFDREPTFKGWYNLLGTGVQWILQQGAAPAGMDGPRNDHTFGTYRGTLNKCHWQRGLKDSITSVWIID